MKNSTIVIGIDSGDPLLIEKWMSQGHLKNLRKLRETGSYGRLSNTVHYQNTAENSITTELLWATFLSGCRPTKTGYWDPVSYCKDDYSVDFDKIYGAYNYQEYPLFYTLAKEYRTAIFDIPTAILSEQANGIEVLGWGGHEKCTPSASNPAELLSELTQKYGKDLIYGNDTGIWWDKAYYTRIQKDLKTTISRRKSICCDLLSRENWDLFITTFGESHSVEHDLYGFSEEDHPLHNFFKKKIPNSNPVLDTLNQIDWSIGEMLNHIPKNANIICFSLHGMAGNHSDIPTMMFLPELLYRFNFPGKAAIGFNKSGTRPNSPITNPLRNSWLGEVWTRNYGKSFIERMLRSVTPSTFQSDRNGLASPFRLLKQGDPLAWMPARWYAPLWSKMKAFALPAFTDGHIRINLKGREASGIVSVSEYDSVCNEITECLYQLQDARTGKPVVKTVIRTRKSPTEDDTNLPNADLVVIWDDCITDVVESPEFGQIGPFPYYRLGGHRPRGFLLGNGPDIAPGSTIENGQVVDLAPTILNLMGVNIPDYFDGKPLFMKNLVS